MQRMKQSYATPRTTCKKLILPLVIASASQLAYANSNDSYAIEEVIVTAQKRAESVQDVPIAISAMSADFVRNVGAQTVNDLGIYTPGLETRVTQATQPSFSIRGITTNDFGIGADPAVAVYVDGVYSGRSGASLTAFQDIERVEVLKGPQGTLFGKNAAAGAIHLISKKPSQDFEADVDFSVGNHDRRKMEAMVNVPLTDTLALRVNAMDYQRDGYRENQFNGKDIGDENSGGARASLLWEATEQTQVLVQVDYSNLDQDAAVDSSLLLHDAYSDDVNLDVTPKETLELWGGSITVESDFDDVMFTSITAIKRFESTNRRDEDGTDLYTATLPAVGTGFYVPLYFETENREENTSFSQEFRLSSQGDENLQWTLGAMYSREHAKQDTLVNMTPEMADGAAGLGGNFAGFGTGLFGLEGQLFREKASGDLVSKSYAIYGDMTYSLTNALDLTVGVRYTRDEKDYELTTLHNDMSQNISAFTPFASFGVVFPTEADGVKQDDSWSNVSSRIVLDYSFSEDVMAYLSYATGYKAGGFNSTQVGQPFDEEQVTNIELGLKSTWFDSRLRLNAALYDYEYEDLQEYSTITGPGGAPQLVIRNQDAEGRGFEMDLIWAASENLTLSANYNYLDTEITDYELLPGETAADDRQGEQLADAAKTTYNLGAEYVLPLNNLGELSFRMDYSYVGKRDFPDINVADPTSQALVDANMDEWEDGYSNLNARITYLDASGNWTVALWAQNLTDEEYLYNINEPAAFFGSPSVIRSTPKFYGLDVSYSF